ncbi:MAG: ThiF family adenylyltransferase [Acidobacteriota bacterium]
MAIAPDRYSRQVVLPQIGSKGQARLRDARALVVGCGALGCMQGQLLARAGVGQLRVVDRDLVEITNIQRQVLFDEEDAASGLPKAEAAARHLRRINSSIQVDSLVADVTPRNVETLIRDVDVVLDATDNMETRYLLNDACVKLVKPWIYGAAIGCSGAVMTIQPGAGPCLRCLAPEPPPPGTLATCDLAGVLNAAPALVASLQVAEAIRLLVGDPAAIPKMTEVELWDQSFGRIEVKQDPECRCCGEHLYEFLSAQETSAATTLCGRNAVQVTPARAGPIPLDALAEQLKELGEVSNNGLLVQFRIGAHDLVIFPDGRAIVRGTDDTAVARSLYARFIGG